MEGSITEILWFSSNQNNDILMETDFDIFTFVKESKVLITIGTQENNF